MPMSRKNKAAQVKGDHMSEQWFWANRKRQRRRSELALQSKRINRRATKGKKR